MQSHKLSSNLIRSLHPYPLPPRPSPGYQARIFRVKMGFPLGEPTNAAAVDLQAALIDEEYEEFKWATDNEGELKELADLVFTCFQYAAAQGWDLDEAYHLVFLSNMSKLDNDGQPIKDSKGKLMKGPNYQPPDLSHLV